MDILDMSEELQLEQVLGKGTSLVPGMPGPIAQQQDLNKADKDENPALIIA